MPKLNHFLPTKPDALDPIVDAQEKKIITNTLKAIEGYVMLACIALGILQIMALKFGTLISMTSFLYLRTKHLTFRLN